MNPIWILLILFGVGLFAIIYFGIKAANKSNIPKSSEQTPVSKLSMKQLRKRGLI